MVTDCRILPIAEENIPGFHAALDVVAREGKYIAMLEAPPIERVYAVVRDNIARNHPQFVVLHGDQVVGWCDIAPNRSRPIYAHSGVVGMGLLPEFRGQGLGRKLLEATIAAAFALGLTRIELEVRQHNERAMALYKRLGFQLEGVHRNAVLHEGRYEDQYSMALLKE